MKTLRSILSALATRGSEWGRSLLLLGLTALTAAAQDVTPDNYQSFFPGEYTLEPSGNYFRIMRGTHLLITDDANGRKFILTLVDENTGKSTTLEYYTWKVRPLARTVVNRGQISATRRNEDGGTETTGYNYQHLKPEGFLISLYGGVHYNATRISPLPQFAAATSAQPVAVQPKLTTPAQPVIAQPKPKTPVQPVAVQPKPKTPVQSAQPVTTAPVNTTVSGRKVESNQSSQNTQNTQSSTTPTAGNTTVSGRKVESNQSAQNTQNTQNSPTTPTTSPNPNAPTTTAEALAFLSDPGYSWMVDDSDHCYMIGKKHALFANCWPLYYTFKPSEGCVEIRGRAQGTAHKNRLNNVYASDPVSKITFTDPTSGKFTIGNLGSAISFRNLTKDSVEFNFNYHGKWVKVKRVPRYDLPMK